MIEADTDFVAESVSMRRLRYLRLRPSAIVILLPGMISGCSAHVHSPSLSLYGSFFPIWLIAGLLGVVCSVVLRFLFVRIGLHEHLVMPQMTYLGAAILSGIMIWAFWTGGLGS